GRGAELLDIGRGATRDRDDELVVALDHDSGARCARAVHPVGHDRLGLLHRGAGRRATLVGLRREDDLSTALEVEAELGRVARTWPENDGVEHGKDREQRGEITPDAQRSGGWCHGDGSPRLLGLTRLLVSW